MSLSIKLTNLSILIFFIGQVSFAQIENITIDERTKLDKLYAGLYARLEGKADSLQIEKRVSFRVGVRATHQLNSIFGINAQTALQVENGKPLLPVLDYAFITKISKRLQIRMGSFATPNTLLRPNPITWQAQTETYTQSKITPGRLGVLLAYMPSDKQSINLGYHYQNNQWAIHLMVKIGNLGLAGWVQQNGDYFGLIDYESKKIKLTLNYESISEEISCSAFYNLSEQYSLFVDGNYFPKMQESSTFRLGVRSYYGNKKIHIGGFCAVHYDFVTNLTSLQLFVNLN